MAITLEINKRVMFINALSSAGTRILRVTVLVWMFSYLLRRVPPEEFAVYALVTALLVFAPLFSSFFTSGISRYVVEACARGDERRAIQIVSSIFPVLVGWGLLFLACGLAVAWHINSLLTVPHEYLAEARLMMGLLLFDFTILMVMTPFAAGFYVRQKYLLLNVIEICIEVFRIGLLCALLLGLEARVIWVVIASVVANLLKLIWATTVSLRLLPFLRVRLETFQWSIARELFSFGLWTTLNQLAAMIFISADLLLLNQFATASDVTAFKLGSEFYTQAHALVLVVLVTVLPALTALHARQEFDQLQIAFLRGARYILWSSLLLTLPMVIFGREFITLYVGPEYSEAATVMALLLLLFPLMPAGFLFAPLSSATGRIRPFAIASIAVQAVKLCVTIVLIKELKLGAFGCALSSLVIVGLGHLLIFGPMSMRLAGVGLIRYIKEVVIRGYPPALVGAVAWACMRWWLHPESWSSLAICGAVGALVYIGTLMIFCLDTHERSDLMRLLHALTRRRTIGPRGSTTWKSSQVGVPLDRQ